MPVTDDQVAALRALLANDRDRHEQLYAGLDRAEVGKGYNALVTASFGQATMRRFGSGYTQADLVRFVGDVRAKSAAVSESLDPEAAEVVLNAVLGNASTRGMSRENKATAQILLLMGLVADEHLDDAGLDAFLADARKLADQILGG
jgi:hypothetical protein